jgi:hypothetical protein
VGEGNVPRGGYDVVATFTVPEARYGINYVQFMRLARDEPINLQFNIKPSLSITPAEVIPGSIVTITGKGFPEEDTGTLTFDSTETDISPTTNKVGTFSAKFTVPDTIAGQHKFVVEMPKMYLDTSSVELTVIPGITLDPEQPDIGTKVTLSGRGFAANSELDIKYDDVSVANSPATDASGNFSHEFTVPESSEKEHSIVVTDQAGNKATFGLPLEGKAPPKPTPITPKDQRFGMFGSETVTFTWSEVSDPSGITYELEIHDNLNFFPLKPGMKKTGLTQNSCTLTIEPGTYYWRVKAIDGAGNESEWVTSPYAFKVGLFSIWGLVIGIVVFLIVFLLLIRAFFRRLKDYY